MADPLQDLRRLIGEAGEHKPEVIPSWGDRAWNGWSIWTKRRKSDEEITRDRRAAYVLSRLNEKYPSLHAYEQVPKHVRDAAELYRKDPDRWDSAYEAADGDYPVYHAMQWAQSLPAAMYATGQMVGNEVHKAVSSEHDAKHIPHPGAYDQYAKAINTLTGGLTADAGLMPKDLSYWHDAAGVREEQNRKPTIALYPTNAQDQKVAKDVHSRAEPLMDGQRFLEEGKIPEAYAQWWGPVMDSAINLPSSLGSAIGYARSGKPLRALADLAADFGMSTPHLTVVPAADKARQWWQEE